MNVAIITGASQGLGLATARALTSRGWAVAIDARREGPLRQAAAELPAGQVVADGEQSRRLDPLLDREQELHAARGALRDRRDHGRRREATARGQVGLVEVDVRVAVDVGEPATLALRDVDRPVVVEPGHPRHRHAVGHQRPCARGQRRGSARALLEPHTLARVDLAESGAVDRGRGHGRQHDGRGVP